MALNSVAQHASFGGTQGVYSHASEAVSCEMEFSVYLPAQAEQEARPVLYYLSGLTCTQDNVTTKAGFQRYASEHGIVIVCPDTSPRGTNYPQEHEAYDFGSGASFYLNATQAPWSTSYRMYSYIVEELPSFIAKYFPVDIERSGIFGHSMGGHGALVIGLRNSDRYRSISAFSPVVAPTRVPWGQKAFTGYLGSERDQWQQYDACHLIETGHRTSGEILIDQGGADAFLEDQLQPKMFQTACENAGQALQLRIQPGYDHSYFFVASFMRDHIEHHASQLVSQ